MRPRALIFYLALGWIATAFAGHGFMNAFGDIEWLPDPGRTPDQFGYILDTWEEQTRLAIASTPAENYTVSLKFAREKLAEIESMVKQRKAKDVSTAITAYRRYIGSAAAALAEQDTGAGARDELTNQFAIALLEHQYIMSINYLDLPRGSRTVIMDVISVAGAQYDALRPRLARAFRESLFFKEEEVRWSTELARQADAQGL